MHVAELGPLGHVLGLLIELARVLEHSAAAKHSVVALCSDRCSGRAGVALLRSRTQLQLEEKLRFL